MKLIERYERGIPVFVQVLWGDHWPRCEKCRTVALENSATFNNACGEGSPLLMEELTKRQAPIVARKRKEVEDWARKAGVFKMER